MVKRASLFSLPQGTKPDTFREYHTKIHATDVCGVAGSRLKKYSLNFFSEIVSGDLPCFGFTEVWWENEKSMYEAYEDYKCYKNDKGEVKNVSEDFYSRVINVCTGQVDEKIIIPGSDDKEGSEFIKRSSIFSLPASTDPDAFKDYHTRIHAADVCGAAGKRLKKYTLNFFSEIVSGESPCFGFTEVWWESEKAMYEAYEDYKSYTNEKGGVKNVSEDFYSRVINVCTGQVDEIVII